MPKPLYLHPFDEDLHYIGLGPRRTGVLPAWVSLHFVAPTFGPARFRYVSQMPRNSNEFQRYVNPTDRIYVMGHCSPGSITLGTESQSHNGDTCNVDELADIFVRHNLPRASQVVIRIHACHSARPSAPGQNDSFAHEFKAEMRRLRYNQVEVQGYDTAVGMYLGWRWGKYPFSSANRHRVQV